MIAMAKKNTNAGQNKFGLVYEIGLTYYNSAWLFGYGGGIFDKNDNPIVNSPGNVKALAFVYDLYRNQNIMPEEITNTLVTTLFNRGQAAMVISGPWFLGEIEKGIDFAVAPLPMISEIKAKPRPFLTVEAMFMSSQSAHKKEAFEVLKYFTSKEALVVMAKKGGQPVANLQAYDDPGREEQPVHPGLQAAGRDGRAHAQHRGDDDGLDALRPGHRQGPEQDRQAQGGAGRGPGQDRQGHREFPPIMTR